MGTIGFIGTGTMGGTLAQAVCATGADIYVCDKDVSRATQFAQAHGCKAMSATQIAQACDFIFLGVKPQVMADLFLEIAPVLRARTSRFVLVSMAAGVDIASIRAMAGGEYPVIRIMPNTPALVGEGMILYTSRDVTGTEIAAFAAAMKEAGRLDELDEPLLNAASALSGCGPAFVYMMIASLADGCVQCGLPRAKAVAYAAQTLYGAAKMVLEGGQHPEKLKDDVCSPGGSTIAGVHALEKAAFRSAVADAVMAAYKRTVELGGN